MSKKKRFGISEALTRGLSETIHVVENNSGVFRNVILPISRIELDPDNPRKLSVNLSDVRNGLHTDDPMYRQKQDELEKLKELAHTIKSSGIINPIVVYKKGELYRVVAGERRCLASILAGKQEIEARIFNEKPRGFDLKLIQWIENTAREDLSLDERLGNVSEIIREYETLHQTTVNATLLKTITGLSLSQTTNYMAVLNAPEDVFQHIKNGGLKNLDKAAFLTNIKSVEIRKHAIESCLKGASIKELRAFIANQQSLKKERKTFNEKRGRTTKKINMGTTIRTEVVKTIVESVLHQKQLSHYQTFFSQINWLDLGQAAKAFRKLVDILETELVK